MRVMARFAAIAVVLCSVVGYLSADVNLPTKPSGGDPEEGGGGYKMDLLAPLKDSLSSRPWLIESGLDPALQRTPGWSQTTGVDWSEIKSLGGGTAGAPTTQAVGGGFLVPYRTAAPAFSRDILITRDFSNTPIQTEPAVVVDPSDPDHIVVADIDYNFPSNSSYVSYDGGVTWDGPNQSGYLPDDLGSGGDPSLAYDHSGNVYMTSISIGEEDFNIGPVYTSSMVSSIAVARSQDGGYTWSQITSTDRSAVKISNQRIDPSGKLRGTVSIGFLDKPWITVGPNPNDKTKESEYVTFVDFELYYDIIYTGELPILLPREQATTIMLVRSDDQGTTWTDPVAVSPTVKREFQSVPEPSNASGMYGKDRTLQGPRPVVGKDGTVYVAWLDTTDDGSMKGLAELDVASSTNGGKTFGPPVIAAVVNELPFRPRNAFFRYWGSDFPRLAIGPSDQLYLVYSARPPEKPKDDGDIYFVKSTDRGKTWSDPLRINGDQGSALQFFPEVAVSPDGTINIMWGDMRNDPSQTSYNIYYTRSTDGGKTWGFVDKRLGINTPDTRVTDYASNPNHAFPNGLFIGDYFGMAATKGDVYMVWADSRLGEYSGFNQKIGFARQRAIKSPDIYISPASGPGGQAVTLQGFNFQPDMNIMVRLGDSPIASARTNKDGRFTSSIFMPITGQGAQNISVYDESGNFASTSFYTDFGFDNIQQLYQNLLDQLKKLNGTTSGSGK